jgi:FkbM family methyltransferase
MKNIILYGFGGLGIKFFDYSVNKNYNIVSIFDENKAGKQYKDLTVENPEIYSNKDTDVVITILNEYVDIDEIKKYLISIGYKNTYTIFEFIKKDNLDDFEHLFIKHPKYFFNDIKIKDIQDARNLLSDKLSKTIFDAILEFRKTFDYSKINSLYDENMYLPKCILKEVQNKRSMNIIDCGACFGDLIDIFNNKNIKINNYYAFEPDNSNLEQLKNKIIKTKTDSCVFPMGVADFSGLIGFNSGSGTGCNIDIDSENKIMVTKIDDVILNKVDFIKMDVEGFENEAIDGMQSLINKHKPILAISVYHKPFDFIDIPLSLSQIIKNYSLEYTESLDLTLSVMQYNNFYLRYHGQYGFEFVIYAF